LQQDRHERRSLPDGFAALARAMMEPAHAP
jgi:hypothetical protein